MSDLRTSLIRLAHEKPELRAHVLPLIKEAYEKVALSQVSEVILEQMGGKRKISVMLGIGSGPGYKFYDLPGNKGVGFTWPNRERSKGNNVEVALDADDTYTMTFFNTTAGGQKKVKEYNGLYNDQLPEIFTQQTGWHLRL